ncbi:hypothetical protein [Streptomyces sp. C]|uniref:hypothetical protein n=1 Tax=Streptomyces sp. C TaxID=253839 RepID=UPI0001B4E3ED|nr:hypothetical protein [Streptomyces sp. C]EFL19825.1 predicted protein [Streptomyces sp. C]
MPGKSGKFAAVAAAATAVVTLTGTPASAGDIAFNTRSVWVDGTPTRGQDEACTTRSMYLASGNYTWTQILDGYRWPTRDLYLAMGTYTWKDCLRPENGYYKQYSLLYKPGSETAYLVDPSEFGLDRGTHTIGSLLNPHF